MESMYTKAERFTMVGTSLLRASGDAKSPGYIQTLGSVLQIAFAPPIPRLNGWLLYI